MNHLKFMLILLQTEVDQLRKANKLLGDDLKVQKEVTKKTEMHFMGDLETIRKELSRCYKNNQDLEVTTSELKEEVSILFIKHERNKMYR